MKCKKLLWQSPPLRAGTATDCYVNEIFAFDSDSLSNMILGFSGIKNRKFYDQALTTLDQQHFGLHQLWVFYSQADPC